MSQVRLRMSIVRVLLITSNVSFDSGYVDVSGMLQGNMLMMRQNGCLDVSGARHVWQAPQAHVCRA